VAETPSLYRRHRPRTFDDVVGQAPVVRTLRNAIERDKVHHAYLFVGSRGTGKTSMAKILAACLNCVNGPTVTPCGVCDSCVSIASATSLDVIEMDAASNNSVDDIRELRERVGLAPVSGKSKVYILDEAHMLSSQAWNAFLKTLEEPPPNTIFVLATTEAQKVLPTVVDRCHRFDFVRPTIDQIASVLRRTADTEGIELPDAAVTLIARGATGSFRDALGTLEQLVTYSGTTIEMTDVMAVLGVVDAELLFGAVDAVAAADPAGALGAVARLNESGRDASQFLRDLEAHGRELLVAGTLDEVPAELRMTGERDERLLAQARRLPPVEITRLLDLVAAARDATSNGGDARVQLELALVKAARPDADASIQALQGRIERLEARLAGATPPTPAGTPTVRRGTGGDGGGERPAVGERPAPAERPAVGEQSSPVERPAVGEQSSPVERPAVGEQSSPVERPAPAVGTNGGSSPAPAPAPVAAAAVDAAPPGETDLGGIAAVWPAVLQTLKSEHGALKATIFQDATPSRLAGGELVVSFPPSAAFSKRKADDRAYCEALAEAVRSVTGTAVLLRCELAEEEPEGEAAPAHAPIMSEEELIDRLKSEFDAEEIPAEEES
jgi:DNA polymerase-3 subunit gamma/tau